MRDGTKVEYCIDPVTIKILFEASSGASGEIGLSFFLLHGRKA